MPDYGGVQDIFLAFGKLGLTAFGGPIAHIGYFRDEFVTRRKWLGDDAFAQLLALCQFLPGPASSQLGFAIGFLRGGLLGALAAWSAFTLPSAIALILFAFGAMSLMDGIGADIVAGLKIAAVAVVAHALVGMARALTPDFKRAGIAVLAIVVLVLLPGSVGQIAAILVGAIAGLFVLTAADRGPTEMPPVTVGRWIALACLLAFAVLLAAALLASGQGRDSFLAGIYSAGALVFGGGHVVLPLLEAETVARGFLTEDVFLAGYGAAQAVPGPLFTFAAYLGTAAGGIGWGLLALVAVFLPGMLLLVGVLPFWARISSSSRMSSTLAGTNAAVVGILAVAFYDPVFTNAIDGAASFTLAACLFLMLNVWKTPPVLVVIAAAICGPLIV